MVYANVGTRHWTTADTRLEHQDTFKVDYNKDASEVFEGVAKYFLLWTGSGTFQILSFVDDIELEHRRHGLASWAPDVKTKIDSFFSTL